MYYPEWQSCGEYDFNDQPPEETVYLGDQPVAILKTTPGQGTEVYYIYADHLNTPHWITRATDNQVVWRWDVAEPFGASLPNENPAGAGQFVYNRRFPGQVYDGFLGVNYNYFRDYEPNTGKCSCVVDFKIIAIIAKNVVCVLNQAILRPRDELPPMVLNVFP